MLLLLTFLVLFRWKGNQTTFPMETNNLIGELHAALKDPNNTTPLEYFKKYQLTDDSLLRIKDINDTLAKQSEIIQNVQSPLGKKQLEIQERQMDKMVDSLEETFTVISELKFSLKDTLKESKNSQNITKWMYIFSFCLGMALIIAAVVFAVMDKAILAIAFGTFGMVDIVAHFIADPPARLQESRSNYVQLIGLTLAWFKETVNNDACIGNVGLFTPEMLKNYNSLSANYVANTKKFFTMMDDLAEPKSKKEKKSPKPEDTTPKEP